MIESAPDSGAVIRRRGSRAHSLLPAQRQYHRHDATAAERQWQAQTGSRDHAKEPAMPQETLDPSA